MTEPIGPITGEIINQLQMKLIVAESERDDALLRLDRIRDWATRGRQFNLYAEAVGHILAELDAERDVEGLGAEVARHRDCEHDWKPNPSILASGGEHQACSKCGGGRYIARDVERRCPHALNKPVIVPGEPGFGQETIGR